MNYYLKIASYIVIGYFCIWIVFMVGMSLKLYFDYYGYPTINYFMKLIYNL